MAGLEKKTDRELILEEIELARQGKIVYEPDPDYVIVRDPKKFARQMADLDRLNVVVSKATYTRLVKRAKREKLSVPKLIAKMVKEQP